MRCWRGQKTSKILLEWDDKAQPYGYWLWNHKSSLQFEKQWNNNNLFSGKKIFDGSESSNKFRFYNNKTKYIDYRMNKLNVLKIINISSTNGKKIYTLILNNVRKKYKKVRIEELKLRINDKWESFVKKLWKYFHIKLIY